MDRRKELGKRMTDIRIKNTDMSSAQLSSELGFSRGYLNAIENGRFYSKMERLYDFCDYF